MNGTEIKLPSHKNIEISVVREQNNVDFETMCAIIYRRLSPNVTEYCTEKNRVIRILQAYKDSEMVVMGDCNEYQTDHKCQCNSRF